MSAPGVGTVWRVVEPDGRTQVYADRSAASLALVMATLRHDAAVQSEPERVEVSAS